LEFSESQFAGSRVQTAWCHSAIKNQNEKFSSGVIQKGAPEIFR
jgi:hypothetical protein